MNTSCGTPRCASQGGLYPGVSLRVVYTVIPGLGEVYTVIPGLGEV